MLFSYFSFWFLFIDEQKAFIGEKKKRVTNMEELDL